MTIIADIFARHRAQMNSRQAEAFLEYLRRHTMIATLYLRAARASDAAIAEQRQLCTGYVEARGWRILDVIVDNGIGGMADPPGLTVLRDQIASGATQAVIATDLARISRDPDRFHEFARFCRQHGADLCLVELPSNIDTLLNLADRVEDADLDDIYAAHKNSL